MTGWSWDPRGESGCGRVGDQREGVIEEWVKMDRLGDGKSVIWL